MTEPKQSVAVCNYPELIDAMRARVDELQISYALVDELAGWANGLAGKLLGPSQVKTLGMSNLWILLGTLGLRLTVENNPEQVARMERRWEQRIEKYRRKGNASRPLGNRNLHRFAREMGQRGGTKLKRFSINKKQRRERARKAAIARWRRVRKARVLTTERVMCV